MCCSSADDAQLAAASASVQSIDAVNGACQVAAGPQIQGPRISEHGKSPGNFQGFCHFRGGGGESPSEALRREAPAAPVSPS